VRPTRTSLPWQPWLQVSSISLGWWWSGRFPERRGLLEHAENVALLHDQQVLAVDLHFGAGPLAKQHRVPGLEVDRRQLAALVTAARADGDDLALARLFLRGIRDDDAAGGFLVGFNAAHEHAVVQWAELHANPPGSDQRCLRRPRVCPRRRENRVRG